MGMFRKPRRPRADADQQGSPPDSEPKAARHAPTLAERLRALAIETGAPEDALDPMLQAVVEATGARAGALCLFDPRRGLLRLAAEVGLSDEGCKRLRTVRAADPTTWDMPLHGLLNRRAYLIESAARNRYVPRLVDSVAPVRTVACVPLYAGADPLGSVILVAVAPRCFVEREIQALMRPLRELARMIEKARGQALGSDAPPTPSRAPVYGPSVDVVRLAAERDALAAERDSLAAELAARRAERERLAVELGELAGTRDRLQAAVDGAAAERAALEADLARARAQAERVATMAAEVAAAEAERDRLRAALDAAAAARDELLGREASLEGARAEAARRADALASELARAQQTAAERVAEMERLAAESESERARWELRLREAETGAVRAREQGAAHERELARLSAELEAAVSRERRLQEELAGTSVRSVEAAREARLASQEAVAELDQARARLAEAEAAVERAQAREQEKEREVARLAAELKAAVAHEQRLREALATAEARGGSPDKTEVGKALAAKREAEDARAAVERELEAVRAELETAEAEVARGHAREQDRQVELGRLNTALRAATEREQRLHEELKAAAGGRTPDAGALAAAMEAGRVAEAARAAAEAEARAAREQVKALEAAVAGLEADAGRAREEIARLTAGERGASAERARLEAELGGLRTAEDAARARVAALERELGALREERERRRAADDARQAEAGGVLARLEALTAERDQIRARLVETEVERDRLRAEGAAAAAGIARLEEALARETAERALLDSTLEQARLAQAELEKTRDRLQADATRLQAERGRLLAEREAAAHEPALVPSPSSAAPPPTLQVVTVGSGTRTSRPREAGSGGRVVAVIDSDATWEGVALDGRTVALLAPDAELAGRLAALAPERVVLNLAARDALGVLVGLRAAGCQARVWGCIANPATDRGVALGMIEPALHPLDPDAILAALGAFVTRGGRAITVGGEVDGFMSLRQALSRQGISVTMAWDAKQVLDLLPVVRPQAVVVDLDLARRDGYAIAAALGAVSPAPHAILLGGGEDAAAAFAATLTDPRNGTQPVPLDRLLASCVGRSEGPPAAQAEAEKGRGRVRAVPGRGRQVAWGK
ncbi:MAG TPA: GAF domain-containing protein [Candidatus Binatia bacterium]|nr:GAF domain-containing protein [Candidatus Binatia bacterium]